MLSSGNSCVFTDIFTFQFVLCTGLIFLNLKSVLYDKCAWGAVFYVISDQA